MKILVVEDEKKVARALKEGLSASQYAVKVAATGEDAFFLLNSEVFDLVLLDWMLPGRSGLEILKTLRQKGQATPVLLLTAKDAVEDRVAGLDAGADDYLVKPFAFPELLARVRALIRRGRPEQTLRLSVEDLDMDLVTRKVTRGKSALELTGKEYDLLEYLMRHARQVVSREMLARDVWQADGRVTPLDNVIDVTMSRLRRKLEENGGRKLLRSVRGVGFVLGEGEA